jgi:dephospho-CoA kinase
MILGVTGHLGAGKGLLTHSLALRYGGKEDSFGHVVREQARRQGNLNPDRQYLQELGRSFPAIHGSEIWAQRLVTRIEGWLSEDSDRFIVIEGFRNLADIETFEQAYEDDFKLIGVTAEQRKRFQHILGRNREGDPRTWEEFLIADEMDRGIGRYAHDPFQNTDKCIAAAQPYVIVNSYNTTQEFEQAIIRQFRDILPERVAL